jgi:peptidase M1-like protein
MRVCLSIVFIFVLVPALMAQTVDPNYRALRDAAPAESFIIENIDLIRDVARITLKTGTVTFLTPIENRRMLAVFRGEGIFEVTPVVPIERDYLMKLVGQEKPAVGFQRLLIAFSDSTYDEIKRTAKAAPLDADAAQILADMRKLVRRKPNNNDNIEAELLADFYNPNREPSFVVYINGKGVDDLRFFLKPSGALSDLPPEEVAVLLDDGNDKSGVWYLSHRASEWNSGKASSAEEKSSIDVEHYTIDSSISPNANLSARTTARFTAVTAGERVLRFDLEPVLRVTKVTYDGDRQVSFIQEKKEEDAGFYVILPEALAKGSQHTLAFEYAGDQVIAKAGAGNFNVGARTSWYPSVDAFNDRATFDLIFHYPQRYTLVAVGNLVKETKDKETANSEWKSDIPLAVAGFNYGDFKRKTVKSKTGIEIEALANQEMPDSLYEFAQYAPGNTWTPTALMDRAISEADASVQVFNNFFGPTPFSRLAITQQPAFDFGQSWPTLVYLPVIAFLDSTQRYQMLQAGTFSLNNFIQEVTPHEVAHQWWGHTVGWATYHDQWLSEGFADFSAALFLQATRKSPADYLKFWEHQRGTILTKNQFGQAPNDAGPLWLGLRLSTPKNREAYSGLVYPKGSYILHMLRQIMWDGATGDEKFIAMMKDFVKTHENRNATTESFKAVVDKHMTPNMDLEGNHRADWFFRDWVYGTEIPRYRLEYSFAPGQNGQTIVKGKLTQSGVADWFAMTVPIYLELPNGIGRLGQMPIVGNQTKEFSVPVANKPKRVLLNANQDILAQEVTSTEIK